mgnify:CR=1 FL=1
MNLADCYRLLGVGPGAKQVEVKESYRRLARRYHPDINPGDKLAQEKFIRFTEAYKLLLSAIKECDREPVLTSATSFGNQSNQPGDSHPPTSTWVTPKPPSVEFNQPLSAVEQQLKWDSYHQLQQLLRERRLMRAIALVEALAQRMPQDPEVRQWQAIAYQTWARHLVKQHKLDKARNYLRKALKTDPYNKSLCAQIEQDFLVIEQMI